MLTLTITLRDTPHQVVLAFDNEMTLTEKVGVLMQHGSVEARDDYGKRFVGRGQDVIAIEISDVELALAVKGKTTILRMRAENECNHRVLNDPTISFLAGGRGPDFGRT